MKTENLNIEYHTELYVYEALRRTGGNMKEASILLGCNLRTLFRYVKKYKL
tara:strand:- start:1621 stop:1773 length:153 start_codon:yes stop_codon:yes gene_type:complete